MRRALRWITTAILLGMVFTLLGACGRQIDPRECSAFKGAELEWCLKRAIRRELGR